MTLPGDHSRGSVRIRKVQTLPLECVLCGTPPGVAALWRASTAAPKGVWHPMSRTAARPIPLPGTLQYNVPFSGCQAATTAKTRELYAQQVSRRSRDFAVHPLRAWASFRSSLAVCPIQLVRCSVQPCASHRVFAVSPSFPGASCSEPHVRLDCACPRGVTAAHAPFKR
ncbi:MAG: hypothetical protein G01um1014106_148 [Parcubacteria group bacterium Gr01-1014_106]|nr:MAG: hypothetical protein G01um1014106_148 [Parcubacteria group bacterium Gr01-1014_106]